MTSIWHNPGIDNYILIHRYWSPFYHQFPEKRSHEVSSKNLQYFFGKRHIQTNFGLKSKIFTVPQDSCPTGTCSVGNCMNLSLTKPILKILAWYHTWNASMRAWLGFPWLLLSIRSLTISLVDWNDKFTIASSWSQAAKPKVVKIFFQPRKQKNWNQSEWIISKIENTNFKKMTRD